MFFMLQLLIIENYCFLASNSLALPNTSNISHNKRNIDLKSYKDASRNNATLSTQLSPMFITLQNSTRNYNLKQNVFDKMLSEEMLSIKNYMHERDMTYHPTYQALPKIYIVTPTLVVKKNWLIGKEVTTEPTTVSDNPIDSNTTNEGPYKDNSEDTKHSTEEINVDDGARADTGYEPDINEKVVGLRSLSNYQARAPKMRKEMYLREGKLCTCMVTNPSTACSHVCTGSSTKKTSSMCTRKHMHQLLSQPINILETSRVSATPAYVVHPAYPLQYHPNYYIPITVLSDIYDYETSTRKHKHKHRKKTKEPHHSYYKDSDSDLYYDDITRPAEHEDEFEYHTESNGPIKDFLEIDAKKPDGKKPNGKKPETKDQNKIGLADQIKNFFSEDVIQECYYSKKSSASFTVTTFFIVIIVPLLLNLFIF